MTISPVYTGRPAQEREPVEQQVYDLLDALDTGLIRKEPAL